MSHFKSISLFLFLLLALLSGCAAPEPIKSSTPLPDATPTFQPNPDVNLGTIYIIPSPYKGFYFGQEKTEPGVIFIGTIKGSSFEANNPGYLIPVFDGIHGSRLNSLFRKGNTTNVPDGFLIDNDYLMKVFKASESKDGISGTLPDGTPVKYKNGLWQTTIDGKVKYFNPLFAGQKGKPFGSPVFADDHHGNFYTGICLDENGVLVPGTNLESAFKTPNQIASESGYSGDLTKVGIVSLNDWGNIVIYDAFGNQLGIQSYLNPEAPPESFEIAPMEFSNSLGLSPDFATKLNSEGINRTITGEKGNWTVGQVTSGWNQDGTTTTEQNVKIVSFEDALVHNAGYPDGILKGTDSQGKTVFWSEEEKAWVRPLEMSTDIENPTFYPWGKQYLAIETALLNPALNKPFSDEVVKNFKGGWAIIFEYDEKSNSSHAYLTTYNIDPQSIRWALDENGKPVWFTTTLPNGIVYESVLTQLLNPADPKNPKADETMFALASAGEVWGTTKTINGIYSVRDWFKGTYIDNPKDNNLIKGLLPQIVLAQRNNWYTNNNILSVLCPSLDSLLSQPGNDPGKLNNPLTPGNLLEYWINAGFDKAKSESTHIAEIYPPNGVFITSDFQRLLFPLSFTGK